MRRAPWPPRASWRPSWPPGSRAGRSGVVGLKPTYGRVSRAGVMPLSWSLDHLGPLTRTVADAALLLGIIAGHDPRDATSSRRGVPYYERLLDTPVEGLRVGLPE